jgi:hypothetical protein
MMECELLETERVAILRPAPEARLLAEDFRRAAGRIDPFIEATGPLNGVMMDARVFPGWRDGQAVWAHLGFIRRHQRQVGKVALVTDSRFLGLLWRLVRGLVRPDVRLFPYRERATALKWLAA